MSARAIGNVVAALGLVMIVLTAEPSRGGPPLSPDYPAYQARLKALGDDGRAAEPIVAEVLAEVEKRFGPRSPEMVEALTDAMVAHHAREEMSASAAVARRALALSRAVHGDASPITATALNSLSDVLGLTGPDLRHERRDLLAEALAIRRAALGDDHLETASTRFDLVSLDLPADPGVQDATQLPAIVTELRSYAARLERSSGDYAFQRVGVLSALARAHARSGDIKAAETVLTEAEAANPLAGVLQGVDVIQARIEVLRASGRVAEADALARDIQTVAEPVRPVDPT